jgi:hypothetical protein
VLYAVGAAAEVEPAGKHDHGKQPEPQLWPNAWTWITERPQLSSIADILTLIGADQQLRGPFTGTMLLPTNEVSPCSRRHHHGLPRQTKQQSQSSVTVEQEFTGTCCTSCIACKTLAPAPDLHQL